MNDAFGTVGGSRSIATSAEVTALAGHVDRAGGSSATLRTILWMLATIDLIDTISPTLSADPLLEAMFRQPRHANHHVLLRHGVTRHPIAAALYNRPELHGTAAARYEMLTAHVVAQYAESRTRAARGLDDFLVYDGDKEFEPVPLGAGPVGLALREFSKAAYDSLLLQLPDENCTCRYAKALGLMQPDFSGISRTLRAPAARYFRDVQSVLAALPGLLKATHLTPRTRKSDSTTHTGGHDLHPGWVGDPAIGAHWREDQEWAEDGSAITIALLPQLDDEDPLEEEAEGDAPGVASDEALELYHPDDAARAMSRLRFQRQAMELRSQELSWGIEVATAADRPELCESRNRASRRICPARRATGSPHTSRPLARCS
jgi:hypothetical protein